MTDPNETLHVHRGVNDGQLCNKFRDLLPSSVIAQLGSRASELSWFKSGAPASPVPMPPGSIFLYAELNTTTTTPSAGDKIEQIGAVSIFPRRRETPQGAGLPAGVDEAAEITRMIVLDGYQRRGVAMELIRAAETAAKRDMGCGYVLVETGLLLEYAQRLYERAGYTRREAFGAYAEPEGRVYFEKWL